MLVSERGVTFLSAVRRLLERNKERENRFFPHIFRGLESFTMGRHCRVLSPCAIINGCCFLNDAYQEAETGVKIRAGYDLRLAPQQPNFPAWSHFT